MRGYSRICGDTSAEMHTGTPRRRCRCSATTRSLAGLTYELSRHTATASARAADTCAASSSMAGSDGTTATRPSAIVRSSSSNVRSRGTGGAGNSIWRSYMS